MKDIPFVSVCTCFLLKMEDFRCHGGLATASFGLTSKESYQTSIYLLVGWISTLDVQLLDCGCTWHGELWSYPTFLRTPAMSSNRELFGRNYQKWHCRHVWHLNFQNPGSTGDHSSSWMTLLILSGIHLVIGGWSLEVRQLAKKNHTHSRFPKPFRWSWDPCLLRDPRSAGLGRETTLELLGFEWKDAGSNCKAFSPMTAQQLSGFRLSVVNPATPREALRQHWPLGGLPC